MNKLFYVLCIFVFFVFSCLSSGEKKQTQEPSKPAPKTAEQKAVKEDVMKRTMEHYNNRKESFKKENEEIKAGNDPEWKEQIVMLGDSITEGFELKKYFPEHPFVNRGIVSDHIKWLDNKGLVDRITPDVLAPNPSNIFILIGVNEINDDPAAIDTYLTNYKELIISLKKNYPKAQIWLQSALPTSGKYAKLNPAINQFNNKLSILAEGAGALYINLHSIMAANGELKAEYSRDGVHITDAAYAEWAKVIKRELNLR